MSRQLDFTKVKDCFVDAITVGEMWFRNVLVYVKKRKPTLTISASAADDKIKITANFNDYEHRYRYFDEADYSAKIKGHGIAYRKTLFYQHNSIVSTNGDFTRLSFTKYSEDGSFSYSMEKERYVSKSAKWWFKAWFCYIDPVSGSEKFVYSPVISGSYNSFL